MSLNIYRSKDELPQGMKYVDYNDIFFNANTLLRGSELEKTLLRIVDKAKYNSELTFIGRDESLGGIFKNHLSTGVKTLLNIVAYPDMCFDVLECGNNALECLKYIHEGNIVWHNINLMLSFDDSEDCDIVYKNKNFSNIAEFLEYVKEV